MKDKTLVIIPARIGSTRLANKPLIEIGGQTMIERAARAVIASGLDNVYVATDSQQIVDVLERVNINTIMTKSECSSGTDRVYSAWQNLTNKDQFEYIINVQGDMPFLEPQIVSDLASALWQTECDIITPYTKVDKDQATPESNVKIVASSDFKALYFSRSLIPNGAVEFLYHVGVYGYKAAALEKFVRLEPSHLEKCERLEQLRALENGMNIGLFEAFSVPISIDTQEDLDKALKHAILI